MTPSPTTRLQRTLRYMLLAAKIILSVSLIYYAFGKIDIGEAWRHMKSISPYAVVGTVFLLLVQICFSAARLLQILRMLRIRFQFFRAVDVVFIGAFFSQTFISFVGGDAMRIWRLVRSNVPVGIAAKGVVLDRVAGFAGLLLLVLLTLPGLLSLVTDARLRAGVYAALAAGICGFVVLGLLAYAPQTLGRFWLIRWLSELSTTTMKTARNFRMLTLLLSISLVIQLLSVLVLYVIANGLSMQLEFWHCLLLIPPVLFLSTLPISFAGWGVREGAMIVALGLVGATPLQSLTLSIFFGLSALVISLPGAVLWLAQGRHRAADVPATSDLSPGISEQ